ncbi:pentatricopeptide repeat-containing protein At2g13600 [Manihot esculenta]|nr:pentatricopeptide repeat-containing protein At2g13600 [Manihot esculenta]
MRSALKTLLSINPATHFNAYAETCVSLLKDLTKHCLITEGSALHGHFIKMGMSSERYVAIKVLIMYLNSRKWADANEIAREFNGFDPVVHNCMISANMQWGNLDEARRLFDEMPERNEVSWAALISGFMKCGRVKESMWYFERNPFQNVVSWTAAISGYVQNGFSVEAVKLFFKLLESGVKANKVTFTSVVRACAGLGDFGLGMSVLGLIIKTGFENDIAVSNSLITLCLRMGEINLARAVFDRMKKRDVVSWTAILDMYVEMGDMGEARRIFDEMPERNEVSWSAMIARYCQSGCPEESLKLFYQMVQEGFKPNCSCFSSVLSALGSLEALRAGMNIHGHVTKLGIEKGVFVGSTLIDLYCKCGEVMDGRKAFDSILDKNVVSWNAMIGGYSMNGQMQEAENLFNIMPLPLRNNVSWSAIIAGYLDCQQCDKVFEVFNEMLLLGEIPNKSTFTSLLCACASMAASLGKGKDLHGKIIKLGIQSDVFVGTALTDMYAKSGDIESSRKVFDRMPEKNEVSWTAMIQGLAESGFAEESLNLFEEMEKASSIALNEFMLLSVLFACSHCGLVDKGLRYFNSMETIYGLKPQGKHYTCIVDMLSRAGRLLEAERFINSMPFQPETNAWAALLSGCKTYKNEEIAERTARKLWEIAEKNPAGYVLLSNIYASAGRWKDVLNVRKLMKEKGLKKSGGCSLVEVKDHVHSFYSGDGTHSQSAEVYKILELLKNEMHDLQNVVHL